MQIEIKGLWYIVTDNDVTKKYDSLDDFFKEYACDKHEHDIEPVIHTPKITIKYLGDQITLNGSHYNGIPVSKIKKAIKCLLL